MAVVAALVTVPLWLVGIKILNSIPAPWLCDYDEQPTEELLGIRFTVKKTIPLGICLALIGGICGYVYGVSVYTALFVLMFFVLALIGLSDGKYTIIPDQFTVAMLVLAVIFAVWDLFNNNLFISSWWSPLLGGICGGGLMLLINFLSVILFKKEGIGFGDVKLFGALGVIFGFPWVFAVALISVFTAFFHFIFLLIFKKASTGNYLPLGPYICIGTAITILFNNYIIMGINWYLSILGV